MLYDAALAILPFVEEDFPEPGPDGKPVFPTTWAYGRAVMELRAALAAEEERRATGDATEAKWAHVWRCSGCGEMRPERDATGPRWTWACDTWEHQCDATHREPARDFGPASEDLRDATIRDMREKLAALSGRYLPLSLRQDPSDETIRDWYERTTKYEDGLRALLGRCVTALAGFVEGHSVHGSGCRCPKCVEGRNTLAALRAAGVEPTP